MEGISQAEAADLLDVVRNAPRWFLPKDGSTELGFVVEQREGDDARRIHIAASPRDDARRIQAAKLETVRIEEQLYKVSAIKRNARGNVAAYVVQWLQHWQVLHLLQCL